MEQGISIIWVVAALAGTFTVRGIYRRIRYSYLTRRRRQNRPAPVLSLRPHPGNFVKVLNYIQLEERG